MKIWVKTNETTKVETHLSFFKPDKQDGKGFDTDLLSLDTLYITTGGVVEFACRYRLLHSDRISAFLQRILGSAKEHATSTKLG